MKKILWFAMILTLFASLTSCLVSSGEAAVTDVSISTSTTMIEATGNATLKAVPVLIGSPNVNYTWSIESGSDYAELSSTSGESVVLTGTNASTEEQDVIVKVKASDGKNSKKETVTITVGAGTAVLKSVSISGSTLISYNARTTFEALADCTGDLSLTYSWKIISGSDYASISDTSSSTVTLSAENTSNSQKTVELEVTVTNSEEETNKVTSTFEVVLAEYGTEIKDEVTGVEISSTKTEMGASANATLTASAQYTGSPSISYSWEITSGSSYASLSSTEGASVKLTSANTSDSEQNITVKVSAGDGTKSVSASLTITISAPQSGDTIYLNLTEAKVSRDEKNWSEITTSAIQPIDNVKIKFTEDDSGDSTGLIKVNAASFTGDLNVYITGTLSTGGVKIQSNGSDTVYVFLEDTNISSSNYPCLEITKGSPTLVELSGTNVLKDGRSFGTGYGEEYSTTSGNTYYDDDSGTYLSCTVVKAAVSEGSDSKGTLYSKGNLTVGGSGSLSVTQSYKNCIASKSTLVINGGTYTLTSKGKNGLFADSSVVVNDGNITFNGTGEISSSSFRKACGIKTDTDDSTSSVYIKGGTLNVTTYNGKGINSSKVYISGGTNTFNVTGVTNYTNDSNTRISYYDADGVSYSNVSVNFAAEGIEGASIVEISGGKTEVNATDDGINVSNSSGTFYLKDGYIYVNATRGDGIDCNGNLYIQGGVAVSYAPTGSEDSFDSGSRINITGGIIAGTSGSQMALSEYNVSGQKMLYFTGSSSSMGGMGGMGGGGRPGSSSSSSSSTASFSKVAVQVSGSTVYAFELPTSSFGLFVMSCPAFTNSSSSGYSVFTSPSFSGGTSFNGLYTTMPTVTTGSSTSTPSIK